MSKISQIVRSKIRYIQTKCLIFFSYWLPAFSWIKQLNRLCWFVWNQMNWLHRIWSTSIDYVDDDADDDDDDGMHRHRLCPAHLFIIALAVYLLFVMMCSLNEPRSLNFPTFLTIYTHICSTLCVCVYVRIVILRSFLPQIQCKAQTHHVINTFYYSKERTIK